MSPTSRWLATADERQARIFCCTLTPRGHWRIEQTDVLRNAHEDEHEHHRPTLLSAPGAQPAHEVATGHAQEEEVRRFAAEVSTWLATHAEMQHAEPLPVFAPARFLGALRHRMSPALRLLRGEFTRLRAHDLADEPAIVRALGGHPEDD